MRPVIAPWRSGEHQTIPSAHCERMQLLHLGVIARRIVHQRQARWIEHACLATERTQDAMRAASSVARRLYERSRSEP